MKKQSRKIISFLLVVMMLFSMLPTAAFAADSRIVVSTVVATSSAGDITVSSSVGISIFPYHGATYEELFEKAEETMWECRNCGHLVMGKKAPEICPVCAHPQSYFEVRKENY